MKFLTPPSGLSQQVFIAARDQGVSSVLFRHALSRALGLNATDSECLSYLSINGGIATPKELGRYTGLTTGSTTTMLDRLEKVGYISRRPNPKDRRGVLVEINQAYTDKAMPLVADVQKAHHELIAQFSDDELRAIARFLSGFTKNVTEQTEKLDTKNRQPDADGS
jgi:DNA-binding MarR family transcriptional regulator